jgi:2-amino-4-hydroxy-6-hydroxymethyldihydropteridine diphosphokinase
VAQLRAAVAGLGELLDGLRLSSVYRTEPAGLREQPDFLNLVASGTTRLAPERLLAAALEIEARQGRTRSVPNAPRTLDVDRLDVGGRVVDAPGLTLPHPRLAERAFVLVPLAEVEPEWRHPLLGARAAELLRRLAAPGRVERLGTLDSLA